MADRPLNQIWVTISNGGMDKEACVRIKQGRKVLELRSRYTTSFLGRLRHTWEAVLWKGPACRSGTSVEREQRYAEIRRGIQPEVLDQVERVLIEGEGVAQDILAAWHDDLVEASKFTPEEFVVARRSL